MFLHPFRASVAQVSCSVGNVAGNLELVEEQSRRARDSGADLLVFPELVTTGYSVGEDYHELALRLDSPEMARLQDLSREVAIAAGFVEETPDARFYNSAVFLAEGRIQHLHRKVYLPTYGVFNEARYFGRGRSFSAFDTPFGRMAMLICADAWHPVLPYMASHDGADVLLVLAASPSHGLTEATPSCEAWERMNRTYALTLSTFVLFANHAGEENGLRFDGCSHVAGPDGQLLVSAGGDGAELLTADLDPAMLRAQRLRLPFRRDDDLGFAISTGRRILERSDHVAIPSVRSGGDPDGMIAGRITAFPEPREPFGPTGRPSASMPY